EVTNGSEVLILEQPKQGRDRAIAISCNPVQHSRTKHIAVRYHFIKEHVEKDRFNYLVRRLGMRSLSPQELERLAKSQ
nr:retrovirus-related Pol polyprotein from transposon TNT 1-94 [Tanacetum cinerariifolium]